jgi:nicotinate-nucleotide--dimethylbenzimidazole phosphoribosyltransferase
VSNWIDLTIAEIPRGRDTVIASAARERWDSLTKPRGSLGRLEDLMVQVAEIQGSPSPRVERRCIYVFCGDHGIVEAGVSLWPQAVTREMVKNFVRGGAAINVLCRHAGIDTVIVDAGVCGEKFEGVVDRRVAEGASNFLKGPAMTREQAATAVTHGMELGKEAGSRFDLAGVGEMGIGNSTSASALLCALAGVTPEESAGRGAGLDDAGVLRKREVLKAALKAQDPDRSDPLSILSAFGGFEIAMMAGFLLGAASRRLPVVIDGFISGAAFLVARAFYPAIGEHVIFGHRSAERGHSCLLEDAGATPMLDLGMRLGEGTGAALAITLIVSAASLYREMATFAEAAVSDVKTGEPT